MSAAPVTDQAPQPRPFRTRTAAADVTVGEILAFGRLLADRGYPVPKVLERIDALDVAATAAMATNASAQQLDSDNVVDRDPQDVADLIQRSTTYQAVQLAAPMAVVNTLWGFQHKLAILAAQAFATGSDLVVKRMRTEFDEAVATVRTAHTAGITPNTDSADLLNTGTPAAITAWRELTVAVDALDRIAALRHSLTDIVGVGPRDHPVAAFITNVHDSDTLDIAGTLLTGPTEWAQYQGRGGGGFTFQRPTKRLGGPWLALLTAGYTLRLNTGSEATTVVAHANGGG